MLFVMFSVFNVQSQEAITTVYGDGHESGTSDTFYSSSTASVKKYNDSNNLLGFVSNGVTYSTGVNDVTLTSNGVSYTPVNFEALPIPADITVFNNSLIGIGYNWGGVNQTNIATDHIKTNFNPIVPSFFMRDGTSGLELGTNFFNIPTQSVEYNAVVINPAVSINDETPDIISTQTGAPSGSDSFRFVDSDGDIVGNEVIVTYGGVSRVGIATWTIYRVNPTTGLVNSLFGANTDRDLRMVSFKLSDFGVTVANYSEIEKFRHTLSGSTDIAFTAYNSGAIGINLPDAELEVSGSEITADNYCAPTTATFKTTVTNNSTNDAIDFIVKFNTPEGITFSSNSSVFSSGSGSASYNLVEEEWNISGLDAGENVQLTLNSTASGTTFPLSFTPTASLEYQSDSNISNNSELISESGFDQDCDGIVDASDDDDDNDGILDSIEGTGDFDNDGIPNNLDLDSDGDQCPDALEGGGTVVLASLNESFVIVGAVNGNGIPTLASAGSGFGQGIGDSQNSGIKTCDTSDTDGDTYINIVDLDDDNDGILDSIEGVSNSLNTDSDSDGCPDALEGGGNFTFSNLNVSERLIGEVDDNGVPVLATANGQPIGSSQDGGVQSSSCSLLPVIISQVYQTSIDNAIELTNIGADVVSNIRLSLFKNIGNTDPTGTNPTESITIASLAAGKSVIIKSASSLSGVTITNSPDEIENAVITDIEGGDDIFVLSTTTDSSTWVNRYDVVDQIDDETSLVRVDETITSNQVYTLSEWISFIDDNIEVFGDTDPTPVNTRHENSPLLSEVKNGVSLSNSSLGYHVVNPTIRLSGSWSNGNPDKSRSVIIQENYDHSGSNLYARKLDIQGSNRLSITGDAIVVLNETNIDEEAEIRILNSGQFIQTHEGGSQVIGSGKLLISQKSELPNTYRYNYWSSPVIESTGGTLYRVGEVLKDASGDLTAFSTLEDINFTSDLDGFSGNPITISSRWIYGYFNEDTANDWFQFEETNYINQGLGFTMKSTGVNPQYFTFTGVPNDGDINFGIAGNTTSLFGNPYPGTLDGRAFILDNEGAIDGTLYFWEHTGESASSGHLAHGYQGGYAQLTLSMSTAATTPIAGISGLGGASKIPSRYIAPGQGFFVSSDIDGGAIKFNNQQRSQQSPSSTPVFFKTYQKLESELPILKLGLIFKNENNLSLHRQIGISFNEKHSYAFDYGYEAQMIDTNPTDVYWSFKEMEDKKLVIAGVEEISDELKIPLTISIDTAAPVSLKIDTKENINKEVYLFDALEGTFKTIEKDTLLSLSLPKGVYTERFFITFNKNSKLLNSLDEISEVDLQVYLSNDNDKIIIVKNTNLVIEKIELFNLLGQNINVELNKEKENTIEVDVQKLPNAVYFMNIKTQDGVVFKKIIKQ